MTILFQQIIITVILVLGFKVAMSEDMLLERVGRFFERKIKEGHKAYDAFYCEWCMSTVLSICAFIISFGMNWLQFRWDWKYLIMWPLIVMGSSFISGNLWNLYLLTNKIKERNESESEYFKTLQDGGSEANGTAESEA